MFPCRFRTSVVFAVAVAALLSLGAAARAQTVLFVSTQGDNANNCTRNAPCRTLQRAINRSSDGGEVQVLDSGAYGNAVNIKKSITISAVGVAATVGAVTIDKAGATVVLRGLTLQGTGLGNVRGLELLSAAAVHVIGCQIERFGQAAISIIASNVKVFMSDTAVRDNASTGLVLWGNSSGARLAIDNSRFENNGGPGSTFPAAPLTFRSHALSFRAMPVASASAPAASASRRAPLRTTLATASMRSTPQRI
jgi:hypothetical protein